MKFGYYPPTPWGDFYDISIDSSKRFNTAIDVLDDFHFCYEVLEEGCRLHRLYIRKDVALDIVNKLTVHCPHCSKVMALIGRANPLSHSALYECKHCDDQVSEV